MKNDSCIFCKIANGEIPSKTLYEDEKFRVILVNAHVRLTRARQQWTGAARQRVCRQVGPYVEPEDAICPIALEYAALTHRLGATGRFLGRLKHKEHVALDGTRLLTNRSVDKSRRRERHGHVTVVTARMHLAGMRRGKGRARCLRDGQGIHVGANRRSMRGARTGIEESADTAGTRMGHLAGERPQHALNISDSLWKIEVELRDPVQVAPIATEFLELGHKGSFHRCAPVAILLCRKIAAPLFPAYPCIF